MSAIENQHDAFGGTIVQRLGDGSMSMFPSSLDAVLAAVAIQRELAAHEVPVRIGVHVGDVIVEPERLTGDTVNIAARIESFAVPGGVMLSDTAHDQIKNRSDGVVRLGPGKSSALGRRSRPSYRGRPQGSRSRKRSTWAGSRKRSPCRS
jgi:class 3 adenylate cyclase